MDGVFAFVAQSPACIIPPVNTGVQSFVEKLRVVRLASLASVLLDRNASILSPTGWLMFTKTVVDLGSDF